MRERKGALPRAVGAVDDDVDALASTLRSILLVVVGDENLLAAIVVVIAKTNTQDRTLKPNNG